MITTIISFSSLWALLISAAVALIWFAVVSPVVFGMTNQSKIGVPQNNRFYLCPSATSGGAYVIQGGTPVLIGTQAAVAIDTYDPSTGGTVFVLDGSCFVTVTANSQLSPNAGVQINPGDELHASGTYDPTTNITYGLTIDKTMGNCPFGNYEGTSPVLSGTTAVASVRLKIGGSPGPYALGGV